MRPFPVELPGIEPATKIALSCGNAGTERKTRKYVKRRKTTCGYAKGVDGINMTGRRLRQSGRARAPSSELRPEVSGSSTGLGP